MSEALRISIGKELSVVEEIIVVCNRILHILQKDADEYGEQVTSVSADVRNYVRDQKKRVTDDATVCNLYFIYILAYM